MKVRAYVTEDGTCPFEEWRRKLDVSARKKIEAAQIRLELGNTSNIKWFSGIGEYRINWGPGYRIYLAQDGDQLVVLFGGGTKKSQRNDIKTAKDLHKEYKRQKSKRYDS